jgi:hypothetical protein
MVVMYDDESIARQLNGDGSLRWKKRLKDERDGSGKSLERTSRGLLV